MAVTYSFVEQLERGAEGEAILDQYFNKWYSIHPVTMGMQKIGIDRVFEREDQFFTVEYKTDEKTQKTGNVFIETMSKVETGRWGWGWTCQADMLIYLALPDELYIVEPKKIVDKIIGWSQEYGLRNVKNKGWTSSGIPVPTEEFAKLCKVKRLT